MPWSPAAVAAKQPLLGTWLNLGSPFSAEIAALAGFDWVLIDREHGHGDERDLAMQIIAAQAGGAAPIVRVASHDPAEIKRALDWGPAGIMAPSVHTPAQARAIVNAVRIPPLGARGAATSTRASRYGFGYQDYLRTANQTLVTILQIESAQAVDNVEQIAAIDGADVLFVGPTDLSIDMNVPDTDPAFQSALARIARAGKPAGILARSPEQAGAFLTMGFSIIALESDRGILARGFARAAADFRSQLSKNS